jgi:hypothetical protein
VHLSHNFPTTLSAFDASALKSSTNFCEIYIDDDDPTLSCIAVIQLAQQTNALWLLPTAFYDLAPTGHETIQEVLQCTTFRGLPAKLDADDEALFLTSSLQIPRLERDVVSFLYQQASMCKGRHLQHCLPMCPGSGLDIHFI